MASGAAAQYGLFSRLISAVAERLPGAMGLLAVSALLLLLSPSALQAQASGDYRSAATGNWGTTATWERYNGTTWVAAVATPTSADGVITIRSPHVVTVAANVTVDQTTIDLGGQVTVNSGVTLTVANGAGDDLNVNGTLSILATTWTIANGVVVNVSGTLTMSGGNRTLTVSAGGTLNITGGSVSVSSVSTYSVSGTITMTGASTLTVNRGNGGATLTVNSGGQLSMSDTALLTCGSCVATTVEATIASGGTLIMGPSTKVTGAGAFTLASGGSMQIGSTAGITSSGATGNVQCTGTRSYNTGSNYTYNGTAAQVTGSGLPSTVNDLTMNNSSGVTLSLAGNTTVTTALSLQNGPLNAGANKVIIPATSSVTATSGWVYAIGAGGLQENFATGSNVLRTFPVGTSTASNAVSVTFASVTTAGDLIAKATAGDHPNIGTSTLNSSKSVGLYWTLTQGASAVVFTNYSAVFNFNNPANLDAGTNTSYLLVGKFNSPNWTYPTVGTRTSTSTKATGITSTFGDFQLAEPTPTKLVFGQQPTNTTAGSSITPAVTVQIVDANGTPTSSTASVTVAIGTNPGSGTLSGTLTQTAVSGTATFNDLSINNGGTGYTLTAVSTGLTGATSSTFDITVSGYWVDKATGSDTNAGTQAAPFATIGKATSVMGHSGTVFVQVGNSQSGSPYAANNVLTVAMAGTSGQQTLIQGVASGGALPLVTGTDPAADAGFDVQGNYVTIDGFEIRNTLVGVYSEASNTGAQISANYVVSGHLAYGIILDTTSNAWVHDNRVEQVSGGDSFFGIWDYSGNGNVIELNKVKGHGSDGIVSHYSTGLTIRRNILKNNPLGIHVSNAAGPVTLYNNTVDGSAWLGIYAEQSSVTVTSRNNIVVNGGSGWGWDGIGTISSNYDDVYNNFNNYNYTLPVTPGANSISANPSFVQTTDPTAADYYKLNAGSPCINAGTDVGYGTNIGAVP